jgi:hypothetical protein
MAIGRAIMIRYYRQMIVILSVCVLVSVLILSCSSSNQGTIGPTGPVGGPCTYSSVTGTANIMSIGTVTGGVAASFAFTPADPNTTPKYGEGNNGILYTGSGQLPSVELLSSNGITSGEILPVIREEIVMGACTPWLYTFPTLSNLYGQ